VELFLISLKLRGRKVLVVGAGSVGTAKAQGLLCAGAEVHVVAPRATDWISKNASQQGLQWHQREFGPADLDGIFLVVAATSSAAVNGEVFNAAAQRGVLCNVVDDPEQCDFFYPAVMRRGALQIAVSTGGLAPALAHRLRMELEQQFGPEYEGWVNQVGRLRREILARDLPDDQRRELLEQIASREAFEEYMRGLKQRTATGRPPARE
jgi:precorrin-2 dehydrogenase/sirohydrochlorin ferrochelatase